ncbi:hypothetical protein D3C86_1895370 [compost metagenome]
MDRDTLFAGIVARPLGHRPAEQHAIEFEPEIVVQPPRPMLLDHETQLFGILAPFSCSRRLWGDAEVALLLIAVEVGQPLRGARSNL